MNVRIKKWLAAACALSSLFALSASLAACGETTVDPSGSTGGDTPSVIPSLTTEVTITLSGDTATTNAASGVTITGSTVLISEEGNYTLSGTLTDGNIIVTVAKTEEVELTFAGVDITCSTTAPVYISSCDKVTIVLEDGTENTLTDGSSYVYEGSETKPNACLYSKDDMVIKGNGSLTVTGNYNNGIGSKNDLRIKGGTITVSAVNNAIKGNDSVEITGGTVTVKKSDDAIKTDNADDPAKGFVYIENAIVSLTADDDGISAVTSITVKNTAAVSFNVGGKKYNCASGIVYATDYTD